MFPKKRKSFSTDSSKESRCCNKSPDLFCFLCATLISSKTTHSLTEANRSLYKSCYGHDVTKYGADKYYVSSKFCSSCHSSMRRYADGCGNLNYSTPSNWQPTNKAFMKHEDYCYVCQSKVTSSFGVTDCVYPFDSNVIPAVKNNNFSNAAAAINQVQQQFHATTSTTRHNVDDFDSDPDFECVSDVDDDEESFSFGYKQPVIYDKSRLNDLIRKLDLSKEAAMVNISI